tara:strand:+ start:1846 stop:2088 length:243 start_codon:yes stop_codon:yes gene_type:complete
MTLLELAGLTPTEERRYTVEAVIDGKPRTFQGTCKTGGVAGLPDVFVDVAGMATRELGEDIRLDSSRVSFFQVTIFDKTS